MRRAAVLALLALLALPGCLSWDTCKGTVCGGSCWVCSPFDEDCGTREPDGVCDQDGDCETAGVPDCR